MSCDKPAKAVAIILSLPAAPPQREEHHWRFLRRLEGPSEEEIQEAAEAIAFQEEGLREEDRGDQPELEDQPLKGKGKGMKGKGMKGKAPRPPLYPPPGFPSRFPRPFPG